MTFDVFKTLAYADIFDYPLTEEETDKWLIAKEAKKTENNLHYLLEKSAVQEKNGFYFLKGREKIVLIRKEKESCSKEKYALAKKGAEKLALIPWIRMVGITGALAMNNTEPEDDIDLVIVTAVNRLWLTRFLICALSPVLGIRRRKPKDRQVKNKICFNLFLEESHLKISPENLFLAHEICQVKPILNKDQTYEKFLFENRWVKKFLPNAKIITNYELPACQRSTLAGRRITNCNKNRFFSNLADFLELIVYKVQYLYMKPKITHERVSLHQAFFHPRDLGKKVEAELEKRVAEYNEKND